MATKKKIGSNKGKTPSATTKPKVVAKPATSAQADDITSETDPTGGSEGDANSEIADNSTTSTQTDDITQGDVNLDGGDDNVDSENNTEMQSIQLSTSLCIVIAAYSGSEAIMHDLWAKSAPHDSELYIIPDAPLTELISEIIANPDIADEFVLIPANCVPLSQCDEADLKFKKLYVTKDGEPIYNSRLPILLTKDICAEILAGDDNYDDAELFFKFCAESTNVIPTEVSFHFGNYVLPISRANFNPKALQELMKRKKFATIHIQEAWDASQEFFKKLVL